MAIDKTQILSRSTASYLIIFTIFLSFWSASPSYAQCSNPHAEMGVLIMNKAHKVMQYCNGDDWVGLWGGGGSGLPSCADGEIAQFVAGEWQCNNGSGIDNLNAANLKSGTVPRARLGSGTANASTYLRGDGSWATPPAADLSNLNASNLTSGTIPAARFPATLPAVSGANLTNLNASNLTAGTVPNARFPATLPAVSGANLTNLNANNITSGTVARARLGSGTANSGTYLRGDGQWVAPPTGGGISQVTTASCSGTSEDGYCAVACPSGYYRTGCSPGGHSMSATPSGTNGCYCSRVGSTGGSTCYAYCAR